MKEYLSDERIKEDLIALPLKAIIACLVIIVFLIIGLAVFMQFNLGIFVKINSVLIAVFDLFILAHLNTIQQVKQGDYYVVIERRVIDTEHEVGAEWLKEKTGVEIDEIFLDAGEGSKLVFDGGFSASLRLMGTATPTRAVTIQENKKRVEKLNSLGKVFYLVCKSKEIVASKTPLYIYSKSFFDYDGDRLIAKQGR